jgi:hypothetical protein
MANPNGHVRGFETGRKRTFDNNGLEGIPRPGRCAVEDLGGIADVLVKR